MNSTTSQSDGHTYPEYARHQPFKHQTLAFAKSFNHDSFAFIMDMGTGKTKLMIDEAFYLFNNFCINGILYLGPNGVHTRFITEQLEIHKWEGFKYNTHIWKRGNFDKWLETTKLPEGITASNCVPILSMNIEAIRTKKGYAAAEAFMQKHKTYMVIDESSRIKNPKAQQTKAAIKLGELARVRRIMSGTPITKGVEDLYTQFRFLDRGILGYNSYYSFRGTFCKLWQIPGAPAGAVKITGYQNIDLLQRKIDPYSFRVQIEDCLDMPERIYKSYYIEMTEEQKKHYKALQDDLYTVLEDGAEVAPMLTMTKLMKMQQVLCGHIRDEEGKVHELKNNRFEAVKKIVEDMDVSTIIWSRFVPDIIRLHALFDATSVTYYGDLRVSERDENIEQFVCGKKRDFIGNPAAGGMGLNLQVAKLMIYFSNDYNLEHRLQSERRAWRAGSKHPITIVDILVPDTEDEKIVKALQKKQDVSKMTLNELRVLLL